MAKVQADAAIRDYLVKPRLEYRTLQGVNGPLVILEVSTLLPLPLPLLLAALSPSPRAYDRAPEPPTHPCAMDTACRAGAPRPPPLFPLPP